jgi:uncharacterized protein YneF (UPF0154 family)
MLSQVVTTTLAAIIIIALVFLIIGLVLGVYLTRTPRLY